MYEPLISVIVPVYNVEAYLNECIDSILNQSFKDFELICVDDCSDDGSADILDSYAAHDSRVTVIHRKQRSGSAAAPRNDGLALARGKYLSILDADDYFDHKMFEKMVSAAEEYDSDLVMCDSHVIRNGVVVDDFDQIHREFLPDRDVFSWRDIPEDIFQISDGSVWHKLIKRDLVERNKLRFQEDVPILDDIHFVNMVDILAERITIVDEKLVWYRTERETSQTSAIECHTESFYQAFTGLYGRLKSEGLYDMVETSLKLWTLTIMEWWLSWIHDYIVYCDLLDRYKTWFFEFGLQYLSSSSILPKQKNFWDMMMGNAHEPFRSEIIKSYPSGSKAAVYGAGNVGKRAKRFIETAGVHRFTVWYDRVHEEGNTDEDIRRSPKELSYKDFDYIIVAINDRKTREGIKTDLIDRGVPEDCIYFYS